MGQQKKGEYHNYGSGKTLGFYSIIRKADLISIWGITGSFLQRIFQNLELKFCILTSYILEVPLLLVQHHTGGPKKCGLNSDASLKTCKHMVSLKKITLFGIPL